MKYLFLFLASLLVFSISPLWGQVDEETKGSAMAEAFVSYFDGENVGNLHIYAPQGSWADPDYAFHGKKLPKGLRGLFANNWREELPEDFRTYAVYQIRWGDENAYILRFAGAGTNNLIALFRLEGDRLYYLRTLAAYHCMNDYCFQLDSWIQDFNGDVMLDILQKARTVQHFLVKQPMDEYTQFLEQNDRGEFHPADPEGINLKDYRLSKQVEK